VKKNPYLTEVENNLPRVLALFDNDSTSLSYGMGDRYHWAWGLIDFANGSFQGAAHGLAILWVSRKWPYRTKKSIFLERIDAMFQAVKKITRSNGSLEEAFPYEGSYCVTALVAFDLVRTLDLLNSKISKEKIKNWKDCIKPLIEFLIKNDESHAFISNHLATAVAALCRWHSITKDIRAERKASQLLKRILKHQSCEGWFLEYEGADPGYQSLCIYYLADVHQTRPDWNLLNSLKRSIIFLSLFAHPDGSFGGVYGSRCTRFYYPTGILMLANDIPEAKTLSLFMENSIIKHRTVTLSSIDEPNLIPMFNAYALSASLWKKSSDLKKNIIPSKSKKTFRYWFPDSGIFIDKGSNHYTIINTHKGGVIYHFSDSKKTLINSGIVIRNTKGLLGSTQSYSKKNIVNLNGQNIEIFTNVTAMPKRLPNTQNFLIIRFLTLTILKLPFFREWIKRLLVNMLITRKCIWPIRNKRHIKLGYKIYVKDNLILKKNYKRVNLSKNFISIHMASQGYWQIQDED